jgi:hypothetical protein
LHYALNLIDLHIEAEHALSVVDDLDTNLAIDLFDHFEEAFKGDLGPKTRPGARCIRRALLPLRPNGLT